MVNVAICGASKITARVTYLFPAMTTVWVWFVERTDTVSMEWMFTYAPVTMASLEGGVRSTLINARGSIAVVMAGALME